MRSKFVALTALLLTSFFVSSAQDGSYYVVIGAFEVESNARNFCDRAHSLNVPAIYSFNTEQKLFYVFVRNTVSKGDAYVTLKDMQAEGFRDAWVYKGLPGSSSTFAENEVISSREPEPVVVTDEPEGEPVVEITETPETKPEIVKEAPTTTSPETTVKPAGKAFVFKLFNDVTGNPVTGQVRLQEAERSNQFRGYNANEVVHIVPPNNKNGRWYVICQVVGFRPYRRQINYANPKKDVDLEVGQDQEIIVPVKLSRVKRGDYIEMDEVKFFNSSDVFTPGSLRELTELVAMMQENPDYKIRIHGHTNGNDGREMISLGQSPDFFALNSSNERRTGSAKELSELRAESVKKYLVINGVDEARILVRGEGGKQPIFDPKGTTAAGNDRVEIEIVKH